MFRLTIEQKQKSAISIFCFMKYVLKFLTICRQLLQNYQLIKQESSSEALYALTGAAPSGIIGIDMAGNSHGDILEINGLMEWDSSKGNWTALNDGILSDLEGKERTLKELTKDMDEKLTI